MADNNGKDQSNTGTNDNKTEKSGETKVFERISNNYNDLNRMMVEEMNLASEHNGLTGNHREQMWVKFFRGILPQKFSLAQGVMIIDSQGKVSKEVDIAVFDEQYTPYVFQYNTLKFIPIEAVAMVIECKSTCWDKAKLKKWAESIDALCTRQSGVARMVSGYVTGITNRTQQSTRTIKILASLRRTGGNEESRENTKKELGDYFDFIVWQVNEEGKKGEMFEVLIKNEEKPLGWWGDRLNNKENNQNGKEDGDAKGYLEISNKGFEDETCNKYGELKLFKGEKGTVLKNTLKDLEVTDNALLSLNLQLNQLLMLFNNPMLFPHFAYAKMFRDKLDDVREK
ncbi:MAG: hypothetical protein MJB12_00040 [Firmicutes bacterium]|nr:hypothetical protein [Bacillota bacterium]